jgi:uncharacterized protein DUF6923
MNLDDKIKEAFARHETDVTGRHGAWREVEKRISRGHRRRVMSVGVGVALAIVGFVVMVPRLNEQTVVPDTAGWNGFSWQSEGVRLEYPPSWTVYEHGGFIEVAPRSLRLSNGDLPFAVQASSDSGRFDAHTKDFRSFTRGRIAGRSFVRTETHMVLTSPNIPIYWVTYLIDWPGPWYDCRTGTVCAPHTLTVSIRSHTHSLEERYSSVAERIVGTFTPITSRQKPSSPRVLSKIKADVSRLAAGSDSLWGLESRATSDSRPTSLLRIDPASKKIVARIPVGYFPQAVAADADSVWVTNGTGCGSIPSCGTGGNSTSPSFPYQNSVMRIDPRTNKVVASISVAGPEDVAIGFGSVWVTGDKGTLVRIDPTTNKVVNRISSEGSGYTSLATDDRYLWAVNFYRADGSNPISQVKRIDPQTNRPAFGPFVNQFEAKIASGFGATWVTASGTESASEVRRIDPATGRVAARITLPDAAPVGLNALASGEGFIWAASARGYLWKIDPAHDQHSDPVIVVTNPPGPANDVVAAFGFVWVASGDGQIWQLAP